MHVPKDKLEWLEFDLLKKFPEISHGTFTRHGGVSEKHFASLNLSAEVGDHPDYVSANREKVLESLELNELVFPHQTHGREVVEITAKNASKPHFCDALYTKEKHLGLGVLHADCQGALFYDPATGVIGVAHAGWKGMVENIYQALIQMMKETQNVNPSDLIVCISPSLGPDHAEFPSYKTDLPEDFWSYQKTPAHFDFWEIAKKQLTAEGVLEEHIEFANLCSFCEEKDYFSHRREKKTGRNASIIGFR